MKLFGMEVITSPALEPGQMLVRSGSIIYGWDLADGVDTCVTARMLPDGRLEIIDVTQASERNRRNNDVKRRGVSGASAGCKALADL